MFQNITNRACSEGRNESILFHKLGGRLCSVATLSPFAGLYGAEFNRENPIHAK